MNNSIEKTKKNDKDKSSLRWRPANINFNLRKFAAAKEIANTRRRNRLSDIKIKFLLPQGKRVEVKQRGNVVREMRVRRHAIFPAGVRNVRYG